VRGHRDIRTSSLLKGRLKGAGDIEPDLNLGLPLHCPCLVIFQTPLCTPGIFIFLPQFFQCTLIHNLLIMSFPFWKTFALYSQGINSHFPHAASCSETPSFSELPAKSVDLAALNLTELVNGMLNTVLRGNVTRPSRSRRLSARRSVR